MRPHPLLLLICAAGRAAAADAPFEVLTIASEGRTVAADLAELNGDGRTDLLQIVFSGVPPDERRTLRVYYGTGRALPPRPDFELSLPEGAGAYDVSDLRPSPGEEVVFGRASDLLVVSLASAQGESSSIPVPAPGTVWPEPDDRGFERVRLVWRELDGEPRLLVPQLGALTILAADGATRAQLDVGGRANYLVPAQPGLFFIESDVEVFFDGPRVSLGEVDGDGMTDVVAATRHEVRVFLGRAGGKFERAADRKYALRVMSERNHVRGAGGVGVQARDLDGDGRLDLLVSHLTGGLADAHLEGSLYLNRGGTWNLERPDTKLVSKAALGSDMVLDVDGDGRVEVLRATVEFSVLALIQALLTRSADARFSLFRYDGALATTPSLTKEVELALSFDTFRPRGFLPVWHLDLNGDGHLDLLASGGGEEIEVFLGGPERRYEKRAAAQEVDTEGLLRAGDLDGDRLPDVVVFDPLTPGAAVRVLRNRGTLAGTPAGLRATAQ